MRFQRIGIIGAGPAGLASARALLKENKNFRLKVFERLPKAGGVWYYANNKQKIKPLDTLKNNIWSKTSTESPMYKYLETNIQSEVMEYADVPFPKGTPTFPNRSQVHSYIEQYKELLTGDIDFEFNSTIVSAIKDGSTWKVTADKDGIEKEYAFDALVVANGHYATTFIPEVDGLEEWHKKSPETVTHSKYYDNPEQFRDKTVLIVGDSSSGIDIAMQATYSAKKVYMSSPQPQNINYPNFRASIVNVVKKYDVDSRSAIDVEGNKIENIDLIVFCTGYLYSVPFLKSYVNGKYPVITSGDFIENLYKQIFYMYDPSLCFIGLTQLNVPMPICEYQAVAMAKYFDGDLDLPDITEMQNAYKTHIDTIGSGKAFHKFIFPQEIDYCNDLKAWFHSKGDDDGLQVKLWNDLRCKQRGASMDMKNERIKEMVGHINHLRDNAKEYCLLPK